MFVIQNSGNTATSATDNVSVNDTLVPILTGLTVTFNGTAWQCAVSGRFGGKLEWYHGD